MIDQAVLFCLLRGEEVVAVGVFEHFFDILVAVLGDDTGQLILNPRDLVYLHLDI